MGAGALDTLPEAPATAAEPEEASTAAEPEEGSPAGRRTARSAATGRRALGLALGAAGWAGFGFFLVMVVAITGLNLLGFRSLVVMSGSMQPTLRTGDLVIDRSISPLQARVGDIVTFRDPTDPTRLITHRIRRIEEQGSTAAIETKGDASNSVQRWTIGVRGRMGRVEVRIPWIGYAIFWVRSRFGALAVLVIPAFLLGFHLLKWIWRPSEPEESGARAE